WEVTLQVYNTGEAEVRNVNLHLELVDADSAAVRDSIDIFAGTIPGGESRIIKAELDGDCINEYLLRANPVLL
ncbi:MAG: FxLYD domain-containing protein, partial [Methanoregulaceae archaeon]|nr:FxLYD domain-containing protein [Methanoregulaceae archaeon]